MATEAGAGVEATELEVASSTFVESDIFRLFTFDEGRSITKAEEDTREQSRAVAIMLMVGIKRLKTLSADLM